MASVTNPRLPDVPINSCFRSRPVLSLRAPDMRSSTVASASASTARRPTTFSRTPPYLISFDPPVLAPIIPPIIGSAPTSIGNTNP